jgi:Carboxypeptidase regulatory-like domain
MRLLGVVLLAAVVSCGAAASPSGGVEGTVTAGPTCPVQRAESPCPPAPWSGTVRATSSTGATFAATTNASGAFELRLPDGTYSVAAVMQTGGPATAKPVSVTVDGGTMQTVDLTVDTGIR